MEEQGRQVGGGGRAFEPWPYIHFPLLPGRACVRRAQSDVVPAMSDMELVRKKHELAAKEKVSGSERESPSLAIAEKEHPPA